MKFRAITLAAAGLLAAASAQAELQTWRYTGRWMDHVSPPPSRPGEPDNVPPEYVNFDLTFDTAVAATGNTYANPLVGVALNGVQLTVQPSDGTLIAGGTWTPKLAPWLQDRLWSTAQPVVHFQVEDLEPWTEPKFVTWAADISNTGWYGFPANDAGIVKIANHGPGTRIDPDAPRYVDPFTIGMTLGAPVKFRFGKKFAIVGFEDVVGFKFQKKKFLPTLEGERPNETYATAIETGEIQSDGFIRDSAGR